MTEKSNDTIKAELLAAMISGHNAWEALIARVRPEDITESGVEDDWSVKDLIAHVATYEDWMAQLLEAGGPNVPHVTDSMTQDETNAWVFEQNRKLTTDEVLTLSRASFDRLVRAVESLSPNTLTSTTTFDWAKGNPVYLIIPGESHNHYAHHSPSIAAWLERQPEAEG
jgi:Protein of unknown function (DUF1706)